MIPVSLLLDGYWPVAYAAGGGLALAALVVREVRAGHRRTQRARAALAAARAADDLLVPAPPDHPAGDGPAASPASQPGLGRNEQSIDQLRAQRQRRRDERRLAGERAAAAALRPDGGIDVSLVDGPLRPLTHAGSMSSGVRWTMGGAGLHVTSTMREAL